MSTHADPWNLNRFIEAQDPVYARVRAELLHGHKTSHWMWFVFPQIAGLGHSAMAQEYAISSLDEARAYLEHPTLRPRLLECTQLVCQVSGKPIRAILGYPDDMKFRSCMTLFLHASLEPGVFEDALNKYFSGVQDTLTLQRISKGKC
jgi:uncharacterized protein (DUF1810 family)